MIDPKVTSQDTTADNDYQEPIYEDEEFFNPFAVGGDADDSDYGDW